MDPITAGTISIDNDSAALVGHGTPFTAMRAGDKVYARPAADWVFLGVLADTPTSNTAATLAVAYQGTAIEEEGGVGAEWMGVRGPSHVQGAEVAASVLALLERLSARGTVGSEEDFAAIDALNDGGLVREGDALVDLTLNRLWQRQGGSLALVGTPLRLDGWADIASGGATNLGGVDSDLIRVTGTATITSFGDVPHQRKYLRFASAATLTHSSALHLPGGANIVTAAEDRALAVSDEDGNWRVLMFQRSASLPLIGPGSAALVNEMALLSADGNIIRPGTSHLRPPRGTTAQRPGSPNNGDARYNTSTGRMEFWHGGSSAWRELSALQAFNEFTSRQRIHSLHSLRLNMGNNTVTSFALSADPDTSSFIVMMIAGSTGVPRGLVELRPGVASPGSSIILITLNEDNLVRLVDTTLTGTTGDAGKLTISVNTDGTLAIENRLGGSRHVILTFLGD